jgi:hypothetical protein
MNINTATDKDNGTDIDTYTDMDTDTKIVHEEGHGRGQNPGEPTTTGSQISLLV